MFLSKRGFAGFVLFFAAVCLVSSFSFGREGEETGVIGAQRPLAEILNPDGSLKLGTGIQGSFDPKGFRMVSGPGGKPLIFPDGSGVGAFMSSLTGLTPQTDYYVRAYATNSEGTAYGNEVAFTTLAEGIGDVERNALITLYNATGGDSWTNKSGWKEPPLHTDGFAMPGTEGGWHGITVEGDHVTRINLESHNLIGTIPAQLGSLTNLTSLNLCFNQLTGGIPAELGSLTNLTSLDLKSNQLTGSIPPELGNLTSLQTLDLYCNQLTGSIPPELGNLANLRILWLWVNQLTGSIPAELGNLTNLQEIYLMYNQLTGSIPPELGNLTNLKALRLYFNKLTGNIPVELANLTNLQTLDLFSNQLTGCIPTSLTNLTNLSHLDIGYNALYANDAVLIGFLDTKDSDWAATQTIAPSNVAAAAASATTVNVTWDAIPYTGNTGGYRVFTSGTSGGPYTFFDQTADKSATSMMVTGLNPGVPVYFVVQTRTDPHTWNFNTLDSEYSEEATATTIANFLIGGSITSSGAPLAGVVVNGLPDNPTTDALGVYTATVPYNWSGTATPTLEGYTFTPPSRTYTDVTSDQTSQDYTATLNTYTISGTVTDGSNPLSGAVITFSHDGHTETTGANGIYSYVVTFGTTTTLTPSHAGYGGWTPATRTITSIDGNRPDQDFAGAINIPPAPSLSSPADNTAVAGTSIEFQWQASAGADRYRLDVRKSADDSLFKSEETGNNTSQTMSGFPDDGTSFKWRVQAGNATGWGEWSAYRTLINGAAPLTPGMVTYPSSSITGSYNVNWTVSAGATSYELERSQDGGTTWSEIYTGTGLSHAESVPDGSYRYRVRATNVVGNSAWRTGASDCVVKIAPPEIGLNKTRLNFGATIGGVLTQTQQVVVSNTGGGTLDWMAAGGAGWLGVTPAAGTDTGVVTISIDASGLEEATYNSQVTFTAPGASNSPQMVDVTLNVYPSGSSTSPFGFFDTPAEGATVSGAIPVTGWALDDVQVQKVEIKRSPHATEPAGVIGSDGLVFISNAIFVEGARPDVEAAFPQYPLNYRAGWGYMLLTNMLPNQGNDTFTLHAFAFDKEGTRINLGQKTIIGNNTGAVKPFGAIDTPAQGEQISGAAFSNFGWALTPQPHMIPIDGSTIGVWVDGVNLGHPAYNYARPSLAALFPGLANTSGPVGLYVMDTTAYANGVHTIAWSVVDNGGNAEGLGSRYFQVLNLGGAEIEGTGSGVDQAPGSQDGLRNDRRERTSAIGGTLDRSALDGIVTNMTSPAYVMKGYDMTTRPDIVCPDLSGVVDIVIKEVERVELLFGAEAMEKAMRSGRFSGRDAGAQLPVSASAQQDKSMDSGFGTAALYGYLIVGDELRPLPIGSTLDPASGAFSWQPGPGFLGEYVFVFVREHSGGLRDKTLVRITIEPKF